MTANIVGYVTILTLADHHCHAVTAAPLPRIQSDNPAKESSSLSPFRGTNFHTPLGVAGRNTPPSGSSVPCSRLPTSTSTPVRW
jgi:hypothetical protein